VEDVRLSRAIASGEALETVGQGWMSGGAVSLEILGAEAGQGREACGGRMPDMS
jgi:hypothetical protein